MGPRMMRGRWREARGHRHVGGTLGERDEARHYEAIGIAGIIGIAAAATALVGAGVSAYGIVQAGNQAEAAAKNQQEILNYNAAVSRTQATNIKQAAQVRDDEHREQVRRLLAIQRAEYGAAGVEISTGSPLLVMNETAKQGALDSLRIKYGGDIQAEGYQAQAGLDLAQGRYARAYGQQQASASRIGAGATLLSGISSAGSSAAGVYGRYENRPRVTS